MYNLTKNNSPKKQKLGWDVGCCGVIKCFKCKQIVYCAKLNIETCPVCLKDFCYWDWENNHAEHRELKASVKKIKKALKKENYVSNKS